ncbi:MAG: hypothetical protein M1828_006142 [Chrysothrix sp. TS-e1954]|nr:MAG: hypothetical protein M1828_006142 [Chrysothrix sp. TS-e1954]
MFKTLQPDNDSNLIVREGIAPLPHKACLSCRAKKLKCSGERHGCHRCLSRGLACQYDQNPVTEEATGEAEVANVERIGQSPIPADFMEALLRNTFDPVPDNPLQGQEDFVTTPQATDDASICDYDCRGRMFITIANLDLAVQEATLAGVNGILRLAKTALWECRDTQRCQHCDYDPDVEMLRIIACQKLNFTHERILNILGSEYNNVHAHDDYPLAEVSESISLETPRPPANEISVQGYEIDDAERPCVFGGITVTQLWSVKSFVRRQIQIVQERGWLNHATSLATVETFVDGQLRRCQKS